MKEDLKLMSKYDTLWIWIRENKDDDFSLSFSEIEAISSIKIDHSFLKYKKDLLEYGFSVEKISMKNQSVKFVKK